MNKLLSLALIIPMAALIAGCDSKDEVPEVNEKNCKMENVIKNEGQENPARFLGALLDAIMAVLINPALRPFLYSWKCQ